MATEDFTKVDRLIPYEPGGAMRTPDGWLVRHEDYQALLDAYQQSQMRIREMEAWTRQQSSLLKMQCEKLEMLNAQLKHVKIKDLQPAK